MTIAGRARCGKRSGSEQAQRCGIRTSRTEAEVSGEVMRMAYTAHGPLDGDLIRVFLSRATREVTSGTRSIEGGRQLRGQRWRFNSAARAGRHKVLRA